MAKKPRPTAFVYIDGFNLYYRALKGTAHKWLDLVHFSRQIIPEYQVAKVKYFTAQVSGRPGDPTQPARQQIYMRALRTFPEIEIVEGNFLVSYPKMLVYPVTTPPTFVEVVKTEEKGSDVNLATHLLCDSADGLFDVALIISNDSDLTLPLKMVRDKFSKQVGVATVNKTPNRSLKNASTFTRQIRPGLLASSQLPTSLTDSIGTITKPSDW